MYLLPTSPLLLLHLGLPLHSLLDILFHLHSLPSFPPSVSYLNHSLPPFRLKVESVSFLQQVIKRVILLLDQRSALAHVHPSAFLLLSIL